MKYLIKQHVDSAGAKRTNIYPEIGQNGREPESLKEFYALTKFGAWLQLFRAKRWVKRLSKGKSVWKIGPDYFHAEVKETLVEVKDK